MAQTALPAPQHVTARRRAFFGLFNADGWPWAIVKALFWFVVIIVMLGYIPDRAYYFTVQRTVDVGVLGWSPVNLCPPENQTLPCPVPAGATLPWYPGPGEVSLPAPRTDGSAGLIGQTYRLRGGLGRQRAVRRHLRVEGGRHRQHRHVERRSGPARGARRRGIRRVGEHPVRHRRVRA